MRAVDHAREAETLLLLATRPPVITMSVSSATGIGWSVTPPASLVDTGGAEPEVVRDRELERDLLLAAQVHATLAQVMLAALGSGDLDELTEWRALAQDHPGGGS